MFYKRGYEMKYIKFKDYQDVLKIGLFWMEKCVNEERNDGTFYHHLPLYNETGNPLDESNIFINNAYKKEFKSSMKAIAKYRKEVESADKKCLTLNSGIMDMRQILPSWIVYPYHPADSVIMTDYHTIFREFIKRMTDMEKSVYRKLYPVPDYMAKYFSYD